jgi:hypothetical protein
MRNVFLFARLAFNDWVGRMSGGAGLLLTCLGVAKYIKEDDASKWFMWAGAALVFVSMYRV